MSRRLVAALVMGACVLSITAGCRVRGPNVLVLSVDSLRADTAHGGANGVTPHLDRFAEDALVFERAHSPAPWTTPAVMSLLTGLPPQAHGVDQHDRALSEDAETLAERFSRMGYRTAAYVPEVTLRAEFGFDRGFERFDEQRYGHARLSSPEMLGKVMNRIQAWRDEPFFIWAHLWDPHYNYTPPPSLALEFERGSQPASEDVQCLKWRADPVTRDEAEFLRGRHEAEVLYTDDYIGRVLALLERLELEPRTIVAIVSDHGEAFLEHGWLGHTNRVDETLVHVPLMLRWPGRVDPGRVGSVVSTASLARTLLDLASGDASEFGLLSPLPLAPDTGLANDRPVLSETRRRGCLTALVEQRFKLVLDHRSCTLALFDLDRDPGEKRDLSRSDPEVAERLRDLLRSELERLAEARLEPMDLSGTSASDNLDALRALGYVQGPEGEAGAGGVDPCVDASQLPRDSFGDVVLDPDCPEGAALACL